jgi:hypothetical protein
VFFKTPIELASNEKSLFFSQKRAKKPSFLVSFLIRFREGTCKKWFDLGREIEKTPQKGPPKDPQKVKNGAKKFHQKSASHGVLGGFGCQKSEFFCVPWAAERGVRFQNGPKKSISIKYPVLHK